MVYAQFDEYPSPEKSYSRNCTTEGNPLPYVWWEKEVDGKFVVYSSNSTTGVRYVESSILIAYIFYRPIL